MGDNRSKTGDPPPTAESTNNESEKPWGDLKIMEKLRFLRRNVTVEPMLVCYIIPSVLSSLATQNLNLEKACRVNLAFGDEICSSLEARNTKNYSVQEMEVQQLVAEMSIWKTLLQSSVPVILIMFLGSWSDRRRKRKPCMLLPIIGEFLTAVALIICTYFYYELPMQVTGVVEAILSAMTGGWKTMFMAIFSYIGDISTEEDRTLRIGVVNMVYYVAIPMGTSLSGILYNRCGAYTVLTLAALLNVFSFIYAWLNVHEQKYPPDLVSGQSPSGTSPESSMKRKTADEETNNKHRCFLSRFVRDFFDFQHIIEIFNVAFRSGSASRRKRVFSLILVVAFIFGPKRGEMTVLYLFTRYRFNWNEVDYSVFSTYSMVTNLIGTLFSVGVFSHMLKIDDALIGVMSCMSKIMAGFVYAFATTTWMIYLAPLVDIVNGTSFIAMRSIASKLVPPEELGKVNSLFGVCEALMPLVYGPMYSAVYAATMHTMPGAFFLLGGALTTPAVVIFAWMYTEHKRDEVLARQEEENQMKKENGEMKMTETIKIDVIMTPTTNQPPTGEKMGLDNTAFEPEEDCKQVH
ncbi:putative peptidoglycan muropeptide transporter SLC46 isoform X2 [Lycorma delicatula]|uniref:putative peptidoglycan muropeptide transporter SLC46 isoform X2 n=1 Tax=Lycorma delicatula TaxID=130591 RepID=UPI003F512035